MLFVIIILSGTTISFYVSLNTDFQLVELCDIEDTESEKESKEHEENQDKKISSSFMNKANFPLIKFKKSLYLAAISNNHHCEIQTPPPEGNLF